MPAGKRELGRLRELIRKLEDEYLAPLDAESRKRFHELLVCLAEQNDPSCAFRPPSVKESKAAS